MDPAARESSPHLRTRSDPLGGSRRRNRRSTRCLPRGESSRARLVPDRRSALLNVAAGYHALSHIWCLCAMLGSSIDRVDMVLGSRTSHVAHLHQTLAVQPPSLQALQHRRWNTEPPLAIDDIVAAVRHALLSASTIQASHCVSSHVIVPAV